MPFWANIIIISVIAFFVSLILTVMLLYMFIFPLVNKLFKTSLPSYNYTFGEDESDEDEPAQKVNSPVGKESVPHREISIRDRGRILEHQNHLHKVEHPNSSQPVSRPKFVDFHKDVPTVKLPEVAAKEKTKELNVSKINAAVVSTKMANAVKKDNEDKKADTKKIETKKTDVKKTKTKADTTGKK